MASRAASKADLDEMLGVAREVAREAGRTLLEHFSAPARGVRTKSGPRDLVSAADVAAERAIRALLARERPGDGLLAEEGGETPSRTGLRWVVDPLDGTFNFLRRIPHWSVSVACEGPDGVLVGAIHDPLRGETFSGSIGGGAELDGEALAGSDEADPALAAVGGEFSAHTEAEGAAVRRLVSSVGHVRNYGSAALDLAWLAAGRWDAVYHARFPEPWDVAAGGLLCAEAGIALHRVGGAGEGSLLAAPPALAEPLLELISGAR